MYARVTTIEGSPDAAESAIKTLEEKIIPAARELAGYSGGLFLLDRASGKMLGVTLWEDVEAMQASEARATELRTEAASDSQGRVVDVERYEVVAQG